MITGSIVALVTPMHADGSVDWAGLERLLELHVEAGTGAIGAVGTTGESATLSVEEHCEVIRHCVNHLRGRLPVVAGTGSNSTWEAIDLTRAAAEAGADACLLVTPYYNRPTQRGLYEHFKAIAAAVDVPQILYNVPGRTCVDMANDTVARLAELDNITGIKDATGDLDRGRELIARCGNESLSPLNRALFVEANPIPVKWALQHMGLIEEGIRLPLTPLDESFHAQVIAALETAGN
jgi:4-hydroxy-tetrahydrodipicolinate synthase